MLRWWIFQGKFYLLNVPVARKSGGGAKSEVPHWIDSGVHASTIAPLALNARNCKPSVRYASGARNAVAHSQRSPWPRRASRDCRSSADAPRHRLLRYLVRRLVRENLDCSRTRNPFF
ncbi:hypothetical protein PR002_g24491 [Phytophthora rubi]|uniref:Uncharacterized protein n=1 Tax=Phytophthora rubi TaxID=129364 RepID=A0A6A3IFJ4_9STRA|nr:hypothetical protein PR002_g24491 [Phytophthora rubi]